MRISKSLIAGLFLLGGGAALAQESSDGITSGLYVGLRGSYAPNGNNVTTWAPTAPVTQLRGSFADGGGGSVFIGTHLPLNFRLEIEGLYRYQALSKVSLDGATNAALGHTNIAAPMLNLFWDFPLPPETAVQPFVGMGVGAAYNETTANSTYSNTLYLRQSHWDPAFSFMAGLALPLDEYSRITAMYRWMQMPDARHKCSVSGPVESDCLSNSVSSSSVDLGFEMEL